MSTPKDQPYAAHLDVNFPAPSIVDVLALFKEKADPKKVPAKIPSTAPPSLIFAFRV